MYREMIEQVSASAINKSNMAKNKKLMYFVSAAFAGSFIGIGVLISFTVGGMAASSNNPFTKVYMGLAFTIALTLVVFTSTELFTGNNYIMTVGRLNRKISSSDLARVWVYSWIGNLAGSLLLSLMFVLTGLVDKGATRDIFLSVAATKGSLSVVALFFRAVFCNFLVCLAVMISCFRTKNDSAKIIIVIMCIFAFMTSGFEHSVANMSIFGVALMISGSKITVASALYNLIVVTIGNIVGGGFFLGLGNYVMKN